MSSHDGLRMRPLPTRAPSRVVIENVEPAVDGGRFPVKRTVGEEVVVAADIFTDGHEILGAVVRYRHLPEGDWVEVALTEQGNDRWSGRFTVTSVGGYEFIVQGWIDGFAGWRRGLARKIEARQDVQSDLLEGAALVRATAERASAGDADWLRQQADVMAGSMEQAHRAAVALEPGLAHLMARCADRSGGATTDCPYPVWADRERARFGAWYELFPRSTAEEGRHGTLCDVARRLPYVAGMGFDVLYLPPIHPIGRAFRKGPNNTLTPGPHDPGSPWAIGGPEGGHTALHPDLGTLDDFDHLLSAAQAHGMELALDVAFQCSPDHPYVREHPEWFRHRPDGTIKYAENPPKKYQDIYPLDFEGENWQGLWQELLEVVLFWTRRGVRIFRVDNPHTKPFRFWEWLIGQVQQEFPETLFLSEAFTRPKVMKFLAKSGFTQSYTYFTWRNARWELTEYFTELTQTPAREYLRPNLFANTPDILPEYLQYGGPGAFRIRLVLAATLGATYGIYGPPFEKFVHQAVRQGSEEYLDSEKYQVRHWDWSADAPMCEFIARLNQIRRENPALQFDRGLQFYPCDNEQILFYGKSMPDLSNVILIAVNLDPHHRQVGWLRMPLAELGLKPDENYQVHDLLTGGHFLWHGESNYIELDPHSVPAHVFRIRRRVKTEQDFDYYM